jgi:glucose/arabinose dehydrogenase
MRAVRRAIGIAATAGALVFTAQAGAQTAPPAVVDPKLTVDTVAAQLNQPVQMEFLGSNDYLVLEKPTGQVKRLRGDNPPEVVLDLTVNSASERGLLGIALDKYFRHNGFVYIYWSETTLPTDNNDLAAVPVLGNRLDRFKWDGSKLTLDRNLLRMRSFQADPGQPLRGNHNGGVVRVGPDGKVYLIVGDTGRRGQMQNLEDGPFVYPFPADDDGTLIGDDDFGGPDPDARHLSGVILRVNTDGSAPKDNPFYRLGAERGGSVGQSLKRLYAYGIRNSFGMAFDPFSGDLWEQENGDDSFSEINRVEPGFNSGWVQVMGPLSRVAQFREIENNRGPTGDPAAASYYGLQQIRWLPENIAGTPHEAYDRLFKLPGSRFSDPEMAWKYEFAPGGIDFVEDRELGKEYRGDLFVGSANFRGSNIFRLPIHRNRREIDPDDRDLKDRVADNLRKYDLTESETLLFGTGFGVSPDVREGPEGTLFVVSSSLGTVFEISRK